ncbi:MAG: hypothetical protein AB7Q01_01820 [Gammaproteobacteria bacterium]|jgi:hypothetical protein
MMDRRSFLAGSVACAAMSAMPHSARASVSPRPIVIEDDPGQTSRWQRVLESHADSLWVISEPTALLECLQRLALDAAPSITGITRSAGELLGGQILARAGYQRVPAATPALRPLDTARPDGSLICWRFVLAT